MNNDSVDLTHRTVSAFSWRFTSVASKYIFKIAVMIVLARLLPVHAFGLIAQAMIVVELISVISEFGMTAALVQCRELKNEHIRVGFTLSLILGVATSTLLWFAAPLFGRIFQTNELTSIIRLLILTLAFTSVGFTASALLTRRMEFKKLFRVEIISYVFGYAFFGVLLSLLDYGLWALVWASIAESIIKVVVLLVVSPHPKRPSLSRSETGQLLRFGFGMSLARIMNVAARNGDYFVVGRWLGVSALGLYSRGLLLMSLPVNEFSSAINAVLFPAYAEIQSDLERLKRAYLRSVSLITIVILPILTLMAITAPELIRGVLGQKWTGATKAFQILCIGGVCRAIYHQSSALVRAKGAVYQQALRNFIYAVVLFGGAIVGSRFGIEGVGFSVVCASVMIYLLMAHLCLKLLECTWKAFFKSHFLGLILTLLMAAIALPTVSILRALHLPDLIVVGGITGTAVLTLILLFIFLPRGWVGQDIYWVIGKIKSIWNSNNPFIRFANS